MGNPYGKEKMAWLLVRDGHFPPRTPTQVQLIISDLCNQNCNFCAYRMDGYTSNQLFTKDAPLSTFGHNNPRRIMATPKALEILDDCKAMGVRGIQFTGGGEPTVHPDHRAIFSAALGHGMACALVSNGLRWADDLIAMLPRFLWVRVSIDAGRAETYQRIRQASAGAFERVWQNVGALADAIAADAGSKCVLGVGYVLTPDNWQEVEQAVMLAKATGARNIRLSAWFNTEDAKPYEGIYQQIVDEVRRVEALYSGDGFKVIQQFTDRMDDLFHGAPDYPVCAYQQYNTYVGGDLNVYRCCVLAYNERGLLGSLKEKRFKDLWQEAAPTRDNFDAHGCPRCQFNDKNRVMNALVGPAPDHVEFP